MLPGHWVASQEALSPYQVSIDLENNASNYGIFDLTSSDLKHAQPVHCFDVRNSAMTHSINDIKKFVQLTWIAPELDDSAKGLNAKGKQLKV
ncbi:putative ferric-chelate reductase 1, partial [Orchesella cincta]